MKGECESEGQLEPLYALPDDPTLSVARLPESARSQLLRRARAIFDRSDCARLARCLEGDADDWDALTVLVRQHVRIEA